MACCTSADHDAGEGFAGAMALAGSANGGHPSAGASSGGSASGGTPLTTAGVSAASGSGGHAAGASSRAGSSSGGAAGGGGGAALAGAGGLAGNSAYQPCPTDGSACRILPLGDSITWGIQYEGAYRVQLFSKALADQHEITFTGSLSNGPSSVSDQPFPRSNEGHSGWRIDQIAGLIPSPALETLPHIILLLIGTNDIYAPSGQSTMPERLGALLDELSAAAPSSLIVVAKIPPLASASWNATIDTYNDALPGLVQSRVAAGKHVLLADMNTGFTPAMLSDDSVHPNKAGYDFIGDTWYRAISTLLP
jgi:lysophospholipase L1-like esterase